MNIYEFIRKSASKSDIQVSDRDVARIAGTLKISGFGQELSSSDMNAAHTIIKKQLRKVLGANPLKAKGTKIEASTQKMSNEEPFQEIDSMIKQGKCARCGKATAKVKLANYETMQYCDQCRVTLW